ncbi:MAG TPA: hypothetical protein VF807_13280, partial [Ktedonobacterales bacterium]
MAQSIQQRVAALPALARDLLAAAAIIGRRTTLHLLRTVGVQVGWSLAKIATGLEAIRQAGLLVEEAENDAYHFAHDVIREVVEAHLGMARRTFWHLEVAQALEQVGGKVPVERLVYHYTRSAEPIKALPYLEQAANRAFAIHANIAAERAYRELVERLDDLGRPLDAAAAREQWGIVLSALTWYEQALTTFEQACNVYREDGDSEAQTRCLVHIGQVHADRGTAQQGIQRLTPLLTLGETHGITPRTLALLHDIYAQLLHIAGQYHKQLEEAERAVAYARAAGDELLQCQIEMRRGNALRMLGRMREASQVLEDVIHTAESVGELTILPYALENVSVVYLLQGEFARAARYIERALALAEQLGDPLIHGLLVLR